MYFDAMQMPMGQINPAALAYLGDAVFELMTREYLLHECQSHSGKLHRRAQKLCSATGQAVAAKEVLPLLDEQELHQFKRGRNAALSVAKKDNPVIHCAASGLETLFGMLYLEQKEDRLRALFAVCLKVCLEEEGA